MSMLFSGNIGICAQGGNSLRVKEQDILISNELLNLIEVATISLGAHFATAFLLKMVRPSSLLT
jgi:hypothetical protein